VWPKDVALAGADKAVLRHLGDPDEKVQYRPAKAGWVAAGVADIAKPTTATSKLGIYTHNTIDPELQRPSAAVGGVYSYQAIAAGTALRGTVAVGGELRRALAGGWQQKLVGPTAIGRSSKDDYGEVELGLLAEGPVNSSSGCPEGAEFTLWLRSDVLVTDAAGAYSGNPLDLVGELTKTLDRLDLKGRPHAISLAKAHGPSGRGQVYARARRLDSWQTAWGLPRPSLVAVQAGSILVLRMAKGTLTADAAHTLAQAGLGERRAEGYGQVEVNPAWLTGYAASAPGAGTSATAGDAANYDAQPTETPQELDSSSAEMLSKLESLRWKKAILRAALDHAASSATNPNGQWLGSDCSQWRSRGASQLGALRAAALQLRSGSPADPLNPCLDRLATQAKWPAAMVGRLRELQNAAAGPGAECGPAPIWGYLGLTSIPGPFAASMVRYAAMVAIDAVCGQAQEEIGRRSADQDQGGGVR
jgi:CRISPR-associated protein Csx10